jgi:hypothetical protein
MVIRIRPNLLMDLTVSTVIRSLERELEDLSLKEIVLNNRGCRSAKAIPGRAVV